MFHSSESETFENTHTKLVRFNDFKHALFRMTLFGFPPLKIRNILCGCGIMYVCAGVRRAGDGQCPMSPGGTAHERYPTH